MSNNFCPNCGSPLEANTRFCGNCGAKIENNSGNTANVQNQNGIVDIRPSDNMMMNTRPAGGNMPAAGYNYGMNGQNTVRAVKNSIFSSEGRINRLPFLLYSLGLGVISSIAAGLCLTGILAIIGIPIIIVCCVVNIMLTIRRCHDLNKSGWMYLLMFVPIVDIIFALYLLFAKGTEGPNQYGPDPLQY